MANHRLIVAKWNRPLMPTRLTLDWPRTRSLEIAAGYAIPGTHSQKRAGWRAADIPITPRREIPSTGMHLGKCIDHNNWLQHCYGHVCMCTMGKCLDRWNILSNSMANQQCSCSLGRISKPVYSWWLDRLPNLGQICHHNASTRILSGM